MTQNLPNRWQEILRREAAENVGTVLAQAKEQPGPRRLPRWALPLAVVLVASFAVFGLIDAGETRARGNVPFARSAVISTRTAGLGASAEDLAPRPAPTLPPPDFARLQPSAPPLQARPPQPRPGLAPRKTTSPVCPECEARRARMLAAERAAAQPTPAPLVAPVPAPTPTPKPPPLVVNVGARFQAVLTDPVITGAAFAPANAKLTENVIVGDRVVLPAGTVLVGDAFATQEGDRAQVVFSAVIRDGKTQQLEGWVLQDGEMGVRGKVVRKGSKEKKGGATLLGAAATGLSFGLAGALPGPGGAALSSLGSSVATDMEGLRHDWRRSDKVVRVEAGTAVTVYLRRDLKLE